MKHPTTPVAAALLLLVLAAVPLAAQPPAPAALAGELDAYVAAAVAAWKVPGLAMAVVDDGEVVFARGYGVLRQGDEEPVDADTLFAIGSTTKAMTAATIGLLVDEGKVGWDDRVSRHLPGFRLAEPYPSQQVTVRDLLTHRAGLGNADLLWYGQDRSRDEILAKVPQIPVAYSLRDGFVYQNILYVAAGEVASAAAGTSWERLVGERLFAPLGMERTVATTTAAQEKANVARPHAELDGEVVEIANEPLDAVAPAGAVWSSAADLARWIRLLLAEGSHGGEQILSRETVAEMLSPQTLLDLTPIYPAVAIIQPHWTSYGLGWFQHDYRGRAVAYHTGSIDGFSAIIGLVPDEELGVVVLANLDHAELRHALMWKVFDLYAGLPDGRDWSRELLQLYASRARAVEASRAERAAQRIVGTEPSLPLASYAGTYRHPLYGDVEVVAGDAGLRLVAGPRMAAGLEHWHHDTFMARFDRRLQGETLITFHLDAGGGANRLEALGEAFERAEEPPEGEATEDR